MYEIIYQLFNDRYPVELKFDTEREMEEHYNIWVAGDDYHFCEFFNFGRGYTPVWAS